MASSALPVPLYRDPAVTVAEAESGDVMPESRARVCCQGCRYKRQSIGRFGRTVWPCWRNNMPGTDGRCAKYDAT